jgi:hypothetical protein
VQRFAVAPVLVGLEPDALLAAEHAEAQVQRVGDLGLGPCAAHVDQSA